VTGAATSPPRAQLVRRSLLLTVATLVYNLIEGVVAVVAGVVAGSVSLVGFGLDSGIEVMAGVTGIWRLGRDADPVHRERAERVALRVIGVSFLALAGWVAWEAVAALVGREEPRASPVGIALAALSVIVMPWLARAKRSVALQLESGAMVAEATQTQLCVYLSAILLGGLVLNATLGWWWADPIAALVMVPIIGREGWDGVRGRSCCDTCAPVARA
jgi:divalent metal cation (Fe/Co/Zn/Cd) transporter